MGKITTVRAYANNEVAYVAWDIDDTIKDCLGFEVTRVYLKADGAVAKRADGKDDRVCCASWVPFKGQHNPNWLPQDTGVWPVQKLAWRDLTARKRRDALKRRPDEVLVRYEVRPVGDLKPGLTPVPPNGLDFAWVTKRDANNQPIKGPNGKPIRERVRAYEGPARPLGYLANAEPSNDVKITSRRGVFRSTFTNGILAAQWLRNVLLEDDGVIGPDELITKLSNPDDAHRKYLAGDVLPLIHELFERPGQFYLALYELEDKELLDILLANAKRIHLILSNSGLEGGGWDGRNADARAKLIAKGVDIQHRMFNNSTHIGHNKFVVHVPPNNGKRSVLTGSTNWTQTGVAGQTNNALLVEDDAVAGAFLDYWKRIKADSLALPKPLTKAMSNHQGAAFRTANMTPCDFAIPGGVHIQLWCSPNTVQQTKGTAVPPDLAVVYKLMRQAKEAILFLAFYPGQAGNDCIIGEAIDIGQKDPSLLVSGAVSSPQAMPGYKAATKDKVTKKVLVPATSPATYDNGTVSVVRAAAIDDHNLMGDFGVEQLTARKVGAIIHDKLVVIDPRSTDCITILGSHNLGFKASYSNDENFLIVKGDQALAQAYAVHILDVFDHYRFRAIETELAKKKKKGWSGFLETGEEWQKGYVEKKKGAMMRYFAK